MLAGEERRHYCNVQNPLLLGSLGPHLRLITLDLPLLQIPLFKLKPFAECHLHSGPLVRRRGVLSKERKKE